MGNKKQLRQSKIKNQKTISEVPVSTDTSLIVFNFSLIDRDGRFAFDPQRKDFNATLFIEKVIDYSTMTWQEIKQQTHDDRKSKNHSIKVEVLSNYAKSRLKEIRRMDDADALFSLALTNIVRVIGIRDKEMFYVLWYDAKHEAYETEKKHT